jgi:hypothetical protein
MTPELLRFERVYKPRTGRADPHLHLDFIHAWEIIAGRGRYELDGDEHDLGPGEAAEVQLQRPHRDLSNPFGMWTLAPRNGRIHVRFDWRVFADRPLLRVLTLVLRPLFRWNHKWRSSVPWSGSSRMPGR